MGFRARSGNKQSFVDAVLAVNLPVACARLAGLEHRSRAPSCALIYSKTDNGIRFT
jgi:hypothetical protein